MKHTEIEPRGWRIVVSSDLSDEEIEEEIDNMLRKISSRVRIDLCFQMSSDEAKNMFYERPLHEDSN